MLEEEGEENKKKTLFLDVSLEEDSMNKQVKSPRSSPNLRKSLNSLFKFKSTDESLRDVINAIISGSISSTEELSPKSQEILDEKTSKGKTGWLYKRGGDVKSWKHRYFILHGIYLLYFNSDKNIQKEKGTINIQG